MQGCVWTGVMVFAVMASSPASGAIMLQSGSLSAIQRSSDPDDTRTPVRPVRLGRTTLDQQGPADFDERTDVDQTADVSPVAIVLDGLLESMTSGTGRATSGVMSARVRFTVSAALPYDFALTVDAEAASDPLISIKANAGPSPLFSFTGGGPGRVQAFEDQYVLVPGTVYTIDVRLDTALPGNDEGVEESASVSYALALTELPEPGALVLLGLGGVLVGGVGGGRRRGRDL
ncbi:MAG: hypothetical protein AAF750_07475 [Planctomycetota bacterium]